MNEYKTECVYYHLCIDKGCPCQLVNHVVRDPKVVKDFEDELEEEFDNYNTFT